MDDCDIEVHQVTKTQYKANERTHKKRLNISQLIRLYIGHVYFVFIICYSLMICGMENTTKSRILFAEMKCWTELFALQNNQDMSI